MKAYNYSKLYNREGKFYNIGDVTISKQGLYTKFVVIEVVLFVLFMAIYYFTGIFSLINPLEHNMEVSYGFMFFMVLPLAIGAGLFYIKIEQYRLCDYLMIYFIPRKALNLFGTKVRQEKIVVNAFVEN